jgi:2-polyprenyl-3-methyl-5-hydroxy-6-metoxy-1,4-benzoquinol methylase
MNPWDERFAKEGFTYGTEPSRWLVESAPHFRAGGSVLCLGEGEGRNGVWLARQGFTVEAVDGSSVGLAKARHLAATHGVLLRTTVADLEAHVPETGRHDAVVLVFLHLPPALRRLVHARAAAALAPGGLVVLEAFTPRQLAFTSGGPRQVDMLYEPATIRADFPGVDWEVLEEQEVDLDEGPLHQGRAALVRGRGRRVG